MTLGSGDAGVPRVVADLRVERDRQIGPSQGFRPLTCSHPLLSSSDARGYATTLSFG